jgi:predicted dehydrogenase
MKAGIAGTGLMGETHAGCYTKLDGIELYAVAEQNPDKQKKFKEMYPSVKIYNDFSEMTDDKEIDIIDICLPTPLHKSAAILALSKNKNVLLEKPIALTIKDAEDIKQAADKSSGKFMVAHVLRFWPEYTAIRNVLNNELKDEQVKSVYAARFNELPLWSENTWIMNEEKSGGIILDLMIHDIDFICWSFGKVKSVYAHSILNKNNYAVQVMAVLEMESGVKAYIDGGYLNPSGTGLTTQLRVYTGNSLIEMYPDNRITLKKENAHLKELFADKGDGYLEEIRYFINCIRNKTDITTITTEDAIQSLKVCLALRSSFKEKRVVTVN